jgi:hypothetical protein
MATVETRVSLHLIELIESLSERYEIDIQSLQEQALVMGLLMLCHNNMKWYDQAKRARLGYPFCEGCSAPVVGLKGQIPLVSCS